MKKLFLTMLMMASCFGVANAQLIIDNNGRVGVGVEETSSLNSLLNVNSVGATNTTVHINPNNTTQSTGLFVGRTGLTSDSYQMAGYFSVPIISAGKNSIGIQARATSSSSVDGGRSYGVMAYAGNASAGYNYGVLGVLNGTANGAGIYGSTSSGENGINTGGRYAGFFRGDVYTTGTLTASAVTTLSDYRVKRNIQSVGTSGSPLYNLMEMNVVEYNYIDIEAEIAACSSGSDTVSTICVAQVNEHFLNEDEKHYGLIAQELQEIYPSLVSEGRNGYLTINYIEIVPLLIKSIQELKSEVDVLKANSSPVMRSSSRSFEQDVTNIDAIVNTLYQNIPNPFTESTLIRCDLSEDISNAVLYIYNLNGEQVAEYIINKRGATCVTIDGGSLNAGMYLYTLIADDKVVDTRRMILTK